MSRTTAVVAAVGLGAVALGLASVALRETFGFSLSYTFVTLVGALAVAQGVRAGSRRRRVEYAETETDDPERRFRVPTPGDEFDEQVASGVGWSLRNVSAQRDVRDRLHQTVVDTLVVHENCSVDEAEEQVETGTWTDDAVAARFLSDGAPALPLRTRVRALFRRGSRFHRQVRHTVAALARLQEEGR
ncbi:hypothetical protein SAMN04487948_102472 [Halogranum amylolyticum]|uniref:Uncharacterized protein n=1 Tax=Halogranum amylolyticum TaxID=660520 RepID=A0A1H8PSS8_9EURY|nr:hypothetical protein [Halogranum amylolyticum]SEO44975.1 hypothetical protein SAMN04487948_102472 [Halogranum amylolyticum]